MKIIGMILHSSSLLAQNRATFIWYARFVLTASLAYLAISPAYSGDIHGTAFKEDSNEPVRGVAVDLYFNEKQIESTNTGSDGTYSFQFKMAGKYQINFTKLPDQCILAQVNDSLATDDTRECNVRVYPKDTKITSKQLTQVLEEYVSANRDPTQALNAFPFMGAAGWDNETLKEIGTKLTAKYPSLFGSFTGTVADYEHNLITIKGIEAALKTSNTTVFIEKSGKVIPEEKAKQWLIGKEATVFSDKRSPESVVKVVLLQGTTQ